MISVITNVKFVLKYFDIIVNLLYFLVVFIKINCIFDLKRLRHYLLTFIVEILLLL